MPVIKSAKKKLRQDKKRQARNKVSKDLLKKVVKAFKKTPSDKALQTVYKAADISVKKNLMHKNKAARLKSSLAKSLQTKGDKSTTPKVEKKAKPAPKKTPSKKSTKSTKK